MSEIINVFTIIILVVVTLCNFKVHFLYSCKFVHLFILEFLMPVLTASSYTHRLTFVGRFKCLAACHVLVLNYIEADHAIATMNGLPMFPYNLWMSCLRQDTSCP